MSKIFTFYSLTFCATLQTSSEEDNDTETQSPRAPSSFRSLSPYYSSRRADCVPEGIFIAVAPAFCFFSLVGFQAETRDRRVAQKTEVYRVAGRSRVRIVTTPRPSVEWRTLCSLSNTVPASEYPCYPNAPAVKCLNSQSSSNSRG